MITPARSLRTRVRRIRARLFGSGTGSWRTPALVAASVVVIIAAAVLVFSGDGDGDAGGGASSAPTSPKPTAVQPTTSSPTQLSPIPSLTKPSPTKPVPPAVGTWDRLPPAPVPAGFVGQAVWTGKELLIHGPYFADGVLPRSVGAAYNPATSTWRTLPVTPDPPELKEARQVAVWSGREMLTWGMVDAAYNPATNTWRRLPPGNGSPAVAVWTGRQALLWGGGSGGEVNRGGVAYDPVTGARQMLPQAPFGGPNADGVWTGKELVVVGAAGTAGASARPPPTTRRPGPGGPSRRCRAAASAPL
jgi:hypothetical protein